MWRSVDTSRGEESKPGRIGYHQAEDQSRIKTSNQKNTIKSEKQIKTFPAWIKHYRKCRKHQKGEGTAG
jgi:hypothetical protein